jgi:hypothetical protein
MVNEVNLVKRIRHPFEARLLKYIRIVLSPLLLLVVFGLAYRNFGGSEISKSFASLKLAVVASATLALLLGSVFAGLRVRSIAAGFGYKLSVRDAVAAVSLGQIGGALFFQIFGQIAARSSYLSRRRIPFAGTVLVTTLERIAAALVSLALAVTGALYLFRKLTFNLADGRDLLEISIGVIAIMAAVLWQWRNDLAAFVANIKAESVSRAAHAVGYSLAIQLSTMAAYIILGHTLAPEIGLPDIAAASALVMFAASIPISFAGWGVREMSAMAALGAVGMPGGASLTVAIAVGVLSLASAGALAALTARHHTELPSHSTAAAGGVAPASRPDALLAAILPVLTAMFVFFQVHLPTQSGKININLADPFAIVGGIMLLLAARYGALRWRLSGINLHVVLCTFALTLALLIGASHIGWTQWAVTNKYLGWFILLAFAATGALGAKLDLKRTLDTFALAGGTIVALQIAQIYFVALGVVPPASNIMGFAQNANAFAFQCLMLLGVTLSQQRPRPTLIALVLAAIIFTGSRAGIGAACVVIATALILAPNVWKPIAKGVVGLGVIIGLMLLLGMIPALVGHGAIGTESLPTVLGTIRSTAKLASSDSDHLRSTEAGIRMFLAHPIFGAGLGVFIHDWPGKVPLVIHSTLLWLLAEFGLVGTLIFLIPVVRLFVSEAAQFRRNDTAGRLIILLIAALSSMSLFHELMYQRTFWFLLGLALATPRRPTAEHRPSP